MIVRILTEGQFSLPGAHLDELNDIDNRLVEVVEREDRAEFNSSWKSFWTSSATTGPRSR